MKNLPTRLINDADYIKHFRSVKQNDATNTSSLEIQREQKQLTWQTYTIYLNCLVIVNDGCYKY